MQDVTDQADLNKRIFALAMITILILTAIGGIAAYKEGRLEGKFLGKFEQNLPVEKTWH